MAAPLLHPRLSLIAAVARNGAIGKQNALIWHEPEDQKHFRRVTMGGAVIMGRKTWDSLPDRFRPLPGRRNLVVTGNRDWHSAGAEASASIDAALATLSVVCEPAFVIGGARIYALALPRADELLLTEIDADLEGDVFFPPWDRSSFDARASESRTTVDGIAYRFVTYTRRT